uniref:Cytochrome c biogenesis protein CcsA n=1 Tax=Cryptomonas curvata TaxID=233186 RepID=A0A222AH90_9CRYP|nr:cytochrome c biogenesis protein [Cryptomonas curvata]ASO75740.1 cytochrome c biogenesis protein [Cryptomonas curvata]
MDFFIKYIKNSLDNVVFLSLFLGVLNYWISIAFPTFKLSSKLGFVTTVGSNLFITIILGWRWIESGYFPLSNLYESLLFFTWGITFITIIAERVTSLLLIGAVTTPLAMFIIGFATLSLPDGMQKAAPLVPALKSNWLMMHVSIMMFSYSTLIIGSLLSIVFLVLTRGKQISLQGSSIGSLNLQEPSQKLPPLSNDLKFNLLSNEGILEKKLNLLESLDNLSYRIIGLGFPLLTIGIIAGAVWANEAWGSYWSWDPKETWALITWLVFAAYLHARITKAWQGRGPAVLASIGFIVVWVCYLGVNFLGKGLHSYGWIA